LRLTTSVAKRFDWTREEVVLVADLLASNEWRALSVDDPQVIELSLTTSPRTSSGHGRAAAAAAWLRCAATAADIR
jgi:hypothetical protein